MHILNYLLILYFISKPALSSIFTDTELKIALTLVKKLEIRHCIVVGSEINDPGIVSDIKTFSFALIPSVYLNYSAIIDHFTALALNTKSRFSTGIIFNRKAFSDLRKISIYIENTYHKSTLFHYYTWLVFTEKNQIIMEENLSIPYNCEFIVIEKENETTYKLSEMYHVKYNNFVLDFGIWNQDSGLLISETDFFSRRLNLNGTILEVVTPLNEECPKSYYSCLILQILYLLSGKMKFRLVGRILANNSYLVYNDTGDFYDAELPYNQFRQEKIGPTMNYKMAWFIKEQSTGLRPDYYFQPFETYIWLALMFLAIVSTLISLLVNSHIGCKGKRNWIDDVFMGIESLCNQCGNDYLQNASLRVTCIAIQVTIIVLVSAYGAVITSFLAVEKPVIPFNNAKEFLANGEYKLGTEIYSEEHWLLTMARLSYFLNEKVKHISNNYTEVFDEETRLQFFKKFCLKKYAMTDYQDVFPSGEIPCNLFLLPKPLLTLSYALFLHDDSPFVEVFNVLFFRLHLESGVKKRLENVYDNNYNTLDRLELGFGIDKKFVEAYYGAKIPKKSDAYRSLNGIESSEFHIVEFSQVAQVLSIPLVGVLLGIFILISEFICKLI